MDGHLTQHVVKAWERHAGRDAAQGATGALLAGPARVLASKLVEDAGRAVAQQVEEVGAV